MRILFRSSSAASLASLASSARCSECCSACCSVCCSDTYVLYADDCRQHHSRRWRAVSVAVSVAGCVAVICICYI